MKSKSWRPWGAWSSVKKSVKGKKRTVNVNDVKNTENRDIEVKDSGLTESDNDVLSKEVNTHGIDFESADANLSRTSSARGIAKTQGNSMAMGTIDTSTTKAIAKESKSEAPSIWDDDRDDEDDADYVQRKSDADDASTATGGTDSITEQDGVPFDWELQRRIWEEQERQLRERGFADQAIDIEMGNKVVLGIGVEIAGCRIHPFIAQDSEIPVAPVTEWFTNCCMDQKGMTVRVFEFEKKRKHLPLNPIRQERKYPKLLGEMELSWTNRRPRGEARFCISVEVDLTGAVIVKACQKHEDGSNSEDIQLEVPRSALCTMRERREMETKEEKSVPALMAPEDKILALPAPAQEEQEASNGSENMAST